MSVDDAIAFLGALAAKNRAKLAGAVGVAVAGHGRWTLDPAREDVLARAWDDAVPTAILVNEAALASLLAGRLDPTEPSEDELVAWTGDPRGLVALADAIGAGETRAWQTRLLR